ncbi:MAG: hypothetical protein ACJAQT_003162 [Akkermansiaceae bacterium]|jgi:hypothetical protein
MNTEYLVGAGKVQLGEGGSMDHEPWHFLYATESSSGMN